MISSKQVIGAYLLLGLAGCNFVPSLFSKDDPITILDDKTFHNEIKDKPYSIVVNFFASWCGHCKHFAPTYITYANNILKWNKFVRILAIDCAIEANNVICIDYGVVAFPTLKFFTPINNGTNYVNMKVYHEVPELIKETLFHTFRVNLDYKHWKQKLSDFIHRNLSNHQSNQKQLLIAHRNENSTLPLEIIFDFLNITNLAINRINQNTFDEFESYQGFVPNSSLLLFDPGSNKIIHSLNIDNYTMEHVYDICTSIVNHYDVKDFDLSICKIHESRRETLYKIDQSAKNFQHSAIRNKVFERMRHLYAQDLESALHHFFFQELPRHTQPFTSNQSSALTQFIDSLIRYLPRDLLLTVSDDKTNIYGHQLGTFLHHVSSYLNQSVSAQLPISGSNFTELFVSEDLESLFVLGRNETWITCNGSAPMLRGYPCGLWTLFHTLTVGMYHKYKDSNAEEIGRQPYLLLCNIREFIRHFFSCTQCVENFVKQADKLHYITPGEIDSQINEFNKDNPLGKFALIREPKDAVLWFWAMHNSANKRLAGDISEDPLYPKIQYPPNILCPNCLIDQRTKTQLTLADNQNEYVFWNYTALLEFLTTHYSAANLQLGAALTQTADLLHNNEHVTPNSQLPRPAQSVDLSQYRWKFASPIISLDGVNNKTVYHTRPSPNSLYGKKRPLHYETISLDDSKNSKRKNSSPIIHVNYNNNSYYVSRFGLSYSTCGTLWLICLAVCVILWILFIRYKHVRGGKNYMMYKNSYNGNTTNFFYQMFNLPALFHSKGGNNGNSGTSLHNMYHMSHNNNDFSFKHFYSAIKHFMYRVTNMFTGKKFGDKFYGGQKYTYLTNGSGQLKRSFSPVCETTSLDCGDCDLIRNKIGSNTEPCFTPLKRI